jgi:uncharacterized protein (DUF1330 family)
MSAYIIASLEVTDPESFAEYAANVPATIAAHGGEYLARGGASELMEGDVPVDRVVVARFPTVEDARTWYHSDEYTALRKIRLQAAHGPFLITTGVDA